MNLKETKLEGVYLVEPAASVDDSGWFTELWSKSGSPGEKSDFKYTKDNHSFSDGNEDLSNQHIQSELLSHSKLVRCTKGIIQDIAIDFRKGSSTFGMWIAEELSEENKRQLLIPKGFAHRFLAMTDIVEFQYKVNE